MRWIVPVVLLVACGGPKIPTHSGYKNDKSKPWKNAKQIKLDPKNEGKADGTLSYGNHTRARWYYLQLPSHGELSFKVEITPPGDEVNEDFDLAVEVLDPGYRVIGKSDKEEEDAGELVKNKTLFDLEPGKYYLHLYLQGRMDSADYLVKATFKPTAGEQKSDFPAQVAFVPSLPMVPINDDTPRTYRPPVVVTQTRRPPPKPKDPEKPVQTVLTARIVGVSVAGNNTKLILGRGTNTDARSGMKAKLNGISGAFPIECTENTCTTVVSATPDQIKSSGNTVTLIP
jgi:hypothetical protein